MKNKIHCINLSSNCIMKSINVLQTLYFWELGRSTFSPIMVNNAFGSTSLPHTLVFTLSSELAFIMQVRMLADGSYSMSVKEKAKSSIQNWHSLNFTCADFALSCSECRSRPSKFSFIANYVYYSLVSKNNIYRISKVVMLNKTLWLGFLYHYL